MAEPTPSPLCAFAECTETGCFGFREPGIANLPHRNPNAAQVWTCRTHQEHGPSLLAAEVAAAARAAPGPTFAELQAKVRRDEGKLL